MNESTTIYYIDLYNKTYNKTSYEFSPKETVPVWVYGICILLIVVLLISIGIVLLLNAKMK